MVEGWPGQSVADSSETSLDAVEVGVRNGSGNGGMVAPLTHGQLWPENITWKIPETNHNF